MNPLGVEWSESTTFTHTYLDHHQRYSGWATLGLRGLSPTAETPSESAPVPDPAAPAAAAEVSRLVHAAATVAPLWRRDGSTTWWMRRRWPRSLSLLLKTRWQRWQMVSPRCQERCSLSRGALLNLSPHSSHTRGPPWEEGRRFIVSKNGLCS